MGVQDNKVLFDTVSTELQQGALKHLLKTAQADMRREEEARRKVESELLVLKRAVAAHISSCSQIIISRGNCISDEMADSLIQGIKRLQEVLPDYRMYDETYVDIDDYVD